MKRYAEDSALIERRAKQWHSRNSGFLANGTPDGSSVDVGRFRKRHPFDCGRSRCQVCHSEKLFGRASVSDKRAAERAAYELVEAGQG